MTSLPPLQITLTHFTLSSYERSLCLPTSFPISSLARLEVKSRLCRSSWRAFTSTHPLDRRDGVVVRASASQSVDLGFIPLVELFLKKTLKNGIRSFPAWRSAFRRGCGEQAGKFACYVLGQGTLRDPPPLCGRQVPHKPRKRQLPSECGLLVQSIAIQFAFSIWQIKQKKKQKHDSFYFP